MEFETTAERGHLRDAARRTVETYATEARIRSVMESPTGFDAELWKVLSLELGVTAMRVPDASGRQPARFADLAAVLEELGRGPVCAPVLGTAVLAPTLLAECGGPVAAGLLARLGGGDLRATASLEHDERLPASPALAASSDAAGFSLDGTDPFVVDAPGAGLLLLPAILDGSVAVFAVESTAPGLTCTNLTAMDQTRRIGRLDLAATPAQLVASGETAAAALRHTRHVARVALAAEQVGGAARCVELTVEYVKTRKQFGVPIGSFQAVKHTCADMLVDVEFARSAAEYAAFCVDDRRDDLPTAALVAGSLCSENYLSVAAATVQLHGGIGFTWDNYAHLYFKRAKSSALLYGQPARQRAELADLIGL